MLGSAAPQGRAWVWLGLGGLGLVLCAGAIFFPLPTALLALAGLGLTAMLRWWPTSGLVLLVVASHFTRFRAELGPVSVRPEHVAVLVVLGVLFLQVLVQRRPVLLDVPVLFALAWFAVNVIATLVNAPDPADSLRHIFRLGLMVLTYLTIINLVRTPRQWWTLFWVFLGLALVQDSYGIIARLVYPLGINIGVQVTNVLPTPVPYGTLEEGNMFGSQSAVWMVAFLALLLAHPKEPRRRRFVLALAVCITALATLLSLSRGAWVALAVGLALLFVWNEPSRQRRYSRAGLLMLGTPLVLIVLFALFQVLPATPPLMARMRSLTAALSDQTFGNRMADMAQAVSDWAEHPLLGWGPGTSFQLYDQRWGTDAWIANQTARTLQETGIAGLIMFWGFLGSVLWIAARAIPKVTAWSGRAALVGLAIGLITLQIAFQSTDGTWLSYMWIHCALLASGARLLVRDQTLALGSNC